MRDSGKERGGGTLFTSWQHYLRAPPRHAHMERVITAHLGVSPPSPTVVHLEEGLVLGPQDKVHYMMTLMNMY